MFDFKNGMLGVVIVALAIAGALFVSYFAGIDETQNEVTKYDYLADVNLLFEYDEEPQYISYDPSTNYTGYYSTDSYYQDSGKYYFAKDHVDFVQNSTVNNYKINYKPVDIANRDVNLSDVPNREHMDNKIWIVAYYPPNGDDCPRHCTPNTLSSIVENLNLNADTTELYITTEGVNWDGTRWGQGNRSIDLNTPLIMPKSWIYYTSDNFHFVELLAPGVSVEDTPNIEGRSYYNLYQSYIIHLDSKIVEAFTDTEYKDLAASYFLNDMVITWGDDSNEVGDTVLDLTEHLKFKEVQNERAYLNPADGVWLE